MRALIICVAVATSIAQGADRPNVVILYTDDQGTLDANCYGSADLKTPNIDRIAANGVRFTQAYAHTVCCPSRAAMLTGRHPQRSGVNSWTQGDMKAPGKGRNMADEEITIAEALKKAGYRTALFGKWHVGAHRDSGPTKQGFDEFFGIRGGFIDNFNHYFLHGNGFHDLYDGVTEVNCKGEFFPKMITERAVNFIEKNRRESFLLYVGFNIPHYPEQALDEHKKLYEGLPMPRRAYASIVTTTDYYIGLILKKLDDLGLTENTIVIFQSDNGHSKENYRIRPANHKSGLPKGHNYGANGGGGNTGKWIGQKGTFLEGGVRVPAIVSWPARLPKGIVRDQAVTIMDWYPSILEWCGVRKPDVKLDGRSLQPIIDSPDAASAHPVIHFQWQRKWAVRRGDWKLVDGRSLRSLADARPEVKDYAKEKPDVVAELQRLHDEWAKDVFASSASPSASKAAGPASIALDLTKAVPAAFENRGVKPAGSSAGHVFDGTGYLDLKRGSLPNPGRKAIRIVAHVRPDGGNGVIVSQGGQSRGYALYVEDGRACFAVRAGSAGGLVKSPSRLPDGWVTIVASLGKDRGMSVSVNGVEVASGKAPGLLAGMPGDGLQVGADTISPVGVYRPENCFKGRMKKVSVTFGP